MMIFNLVIAFMVSLVMSGCLGPTILANRSMVEFYNATTDGKNYKSADKASSTIDAAKEYDQAASVNTGDGTSNTENAPSTGKDEAKSVPEVKRESGESSSK